MVHETLCHSVSVQFHTPSTTGPSSAPQYRQYTWSRLPLQGMGDRLPWIRCYPISQQRIMFRKKGLFPLQDSAVMDKCLPPPTRQISIQQWWQSLCFQHNVPGYSERILRNVSFSVEAHNLLQSLSVLRKSVRSVRASHFCWGKKNYRLKSRVSSETLLRCYERVPSFPVHLRKLKFCFVLKLAVFWEGVKSLKFHCFR